MGEDRPRYNAVFNARTRVGHEPAVAGGSFPAVQSAGCGPRQATGLKIACSDLVA
jgi:hypothetical protein